MTDAHLKITFCNHRGLSALMERDPCFWGMGLMMPRAHVAGIIPWLRNCPRASVMGCKKDGHMYENFGRNAVDPGGRAGFHGFQGCLGAAGGGGMWGRGVLVSWWHMPGPAPSGAVACGPSQARAAQYRSKCNALLRSARTPSPPCSLSVQGRTARAVPHGPHGSDHAALLVLCSGTHPMPSVLPKVINSAWARTQCLQFCQK